MTVPNIVIGEAVRRYLAANPDERAGAHRLLETLETGAELWSRSTVPVHVTCSAAVINGRDEILMIHHRTLGAWLAPGGHLEAADDDLLGGARRELEEETGIPAAAVADVPDGSGMEGLPLDIDLHRIPANPARGEPEHWHADFCFAFRVPDLDVRLFRLQTEEVTDHVWRPVANMPTGRLTAKINRFPGE